MEEYSGNIIVMQVGPVVYSASLELSRTTYPGSIRNGTSLLSAYALPGSQARGAQPVADGNSLQSIAFTSVDVTGRGVLLTIERGGQMGRVSLRAIVITLTSGMVLVQFAGAIVQVCPALEWRLTFQAVLEPGARASSRSAILPWRGGYLENEQAHMLGTSRTLGTRGTQMLPNRRGP
jgi:hypothetical protein